MNYDIEFDTHRDLWGFKFPENTPLRILVCGGRDYANFNRVKEILDRFRSLELQRPIMCFGGARGADTLAERWAIMSGIEHKVFHADWNKYGKSAGYKRNRQMLEEFKPNIVIAFPGGVGTQMMVNIALEANVRVFQITDNDVMEIPF